LHSEHYQWLLLPPKRGSYVERRRKKNKENHNRVSTRHEGYWMPWYFPWQLYLAPSNLMAAVIHLYTRDFFFCVCVSPRIWKENFSFFICLVCVYKWRNWWLTNIYSHWCFLFLFEKRFNGFTRQLCDIFNIGWCW
jgi:hypothetical protein